MKRVSRNERRLRVDLSGFDSVRRMPGIGRKRGVLPDEGEPPGGEETLTMTALEQLP
jgi:hypothetical protein